MAYLTFTASEDNQGTCFKFIGANSSNTEGVRLLSSNTSLISNNTSLISSSSDNCLDTCSFYEGPSDSTIMAFGESSETAGTIASAGGETCGSIAFSGSAGETCGSIASSSVSSGSSFSGGGCSYSC